MKRLLIVNEKILIVITLQEEMFPLRLKTLYIQTNSLPLFHPTKFHTSTYKHISIKQYKG